LEQLIENSAAGLKPTSKAHRKFYRRGLNLSPVLEQQPEQRVFFHREVNLLACARHVLLGKVYLDVAKVHQAVAASRQNTT
jgi:hypothetical protein